MIADIGLEIALHGAMDRVRDGMRHQDIPVMLVATRRLHSLFSEADRTGRKDLFPLALQARDLVDQALAMISTSGSRAPVAQHTGPRAAYAAVEGLTA